jgi:hypothetical protein
MKITRSRLKQIIMEELERLIEAPTEDPAVNELIGTLEFIIEDVVRVLKEGGRTLDDALRLGLQEIWYTGAKEDYEVEEREEQLNDLLADYSGEQIMAASQWLLKHHWKQEVVDYGGDSLAMQAALQEAKREPIDPSPLSPEDRHNVEARIEAALRSGPIDWSKKTDYELKRLLNDLIQKGLMPKGI